MWLRVLFSVGARRDLSGTLKAIVTAYAAYLTLWVLWSATFVVLHPLTHAILFVCFILTLMFLVIGPAPDARIDEPSIVDYGLSTLGLICGGYFALSAETIASRISLFDPLSRADIVFGSLICALALEATRRAVGLALMLIAVAFIAYNLFGHLLDGVMTHGFITYEHFLDQSVFTTNGLFGAPVRVAATYAFLFVTFGVFFQRAGGGQFFFDLAAALAGRTPGGPAKVAITSSALYGTMSGSPTSDVVTTGSVTIPMMKRYGYPATLAGAIEVVASTGGSIVPPIMGSAAFIMVEITGIPYQTVVIAAIIPAMLFYLTLYVQVHLGALRAGFTRATDDIPALSDTLRQGIPFAVPLLVLVGALLAGYTPTLVAVFGVIAAIISSLPNKKTRMGLRDLYEGLAEATLRMVPVAAACAAAGLVVGGLSLTGLAGKFSYIIFDFSQGYAWPSLLLAGVLCIGLGMGMPTPSAYILSAVLIGDVLTTLGVELLPAHMFLLFFSALSALTPPVAVAAYAAASIAEANPLSIAVGAVRLALVLFVLPFAFVYQPELLAQGPALWVIWAAATALAGVLPLSAANAGYWRGRLNALQRLGFCVGGLGLLLPGLLTDIVGLTVTGLVALTVRGRAENVPNRSR